MATITSQAPYDSIPDILTLSNQGVNLFLNYLLKRV